jgi:hypothetical protein
MRGRRAQKPRQLTLLDIPAPPRPVPPAFRTPAAERGQREARSRLTLAALLDNLRLGRRATDVEVG